MTWLNSVKHLQSYAPYLSVIPFVCVKTREPFGRGIEILYITWAQKNKQIHFFRLEPFHPPPPPPLPPTHIWILQNSFTREFKIKVVGFVLEQLFKYFEMLIVPHALHCVDGCFFVNSLAYCFGFSPPQIFWNVDCTTCFTLCRWLLFCKQSSLLFWFQPSPNILKCWLYHMLYIV